MTCANCQRLQEDKDIFKQSLLECAKEKIKLRETVNRYEHALFSLKETSEGPIKEWAKNLLQ